MKVTISHDQDAQNPIEDDGWALHSFSRGQFGFVDPSDLGLGDELNKDGKPDVNDSELRAKLESGLAFFLSYFEHGGSLWSLFGEGNNCQFDSVRCAGMLVWEQDEENIGAKTVAERRKDAQQRLDSYNAWANGEVYGYSIEEQETCPTCKHVSETDEGESCWGFLGNDLDYMFSRIKEIVGEKQVTFAGDCAHLADYHWEKLTGNVPTG
jgi:hypothetical protein